jgi:hypothetical protein
VELVQIPDPPLTDPRGDQRGEPGIAEEEPAPWRDPVGLVVEALGEEACEVGEHVALQELGVQLGHAVHAVAPHHREVRHPHLLLGALLDQRHPPQPVGVEGVADLHLAEEALVDLVDDLQMPGEETLEQAHRPHLQRLGEQGVVGVSEGRDGHLPRLVPGHVLLVDHQPHQLGDGHGRMRVVELDGDPVGEGPEVLVAPQVPPDDVRQAAGDEEVLLPETELLAGLVLVVGVEDLADDLGLVLLDDAALVVAVIEEAEVELLRGSCLPEPQRVHRRHAVAGHRHVVGDAEHRPAAHPAGGGRPVAPGPALHRSVEAYRHRLLRPDDLPGVAELEPLVGALHLVPADDVLAEDPELVADAVAHPRVAVGGHGVEEAGREPAETAVAQPRVRLELDERVEVHARSAQPLARGVQQPGRNEVVSQRPAEEVLGGEVVRALRVERAVGLLRRHPALGEPVPHRHRDGLEPVPGGGTVRALASRVLDVGEERALQCVRVAPEVRHLGRRGRGLGNESDRAVAHRRP